MTNEKLYIAGCLHVLGMARLEFRTSKGTVLGNSMDGNLPMFGFGG